jgi:hypothetical protein
MDQIKIALWRGVILSPELCKEAVAHLFHTGMNQYTHVRYSFLYSIRAQVGSCQELAANRQERLSWPLAEPVDSATVDQRRELAAPANVRQVCKRQASSQTSGYVINLCSTE